MPFPAASLPLSLAASVAHFSSFCHIHDCLLCGPRALQLRLIDSRCRYLLTGLNLSPDSLALGLGKSGAHSRQLTRESERNTGVKQFQFL